MKLTEKELVQAQTFVDFVLAREKDAASPAHFIATTVGRLIAEVRESRALLSPSVGTPCSRDSMCTRPDSHTSPHDEVGR